MTNGWIRAALSLGLPGIHPKYVLEHLSPTFMPETFGQVERGSGEKHELASLDTNWRRRTP